MCFLSSASGSTELAATLGTPVKMKVKQQLETIQGEEVVQN
jgi:hypothetical protein